MADFVCECGKTFGTRDNLTRHRRMFCKGVGPLETACRFCERTFATHAGMHKHQRGCAVPTGSDLVCVCGKIYLTRAALAQHKRYYCREGEPLENTCQLCGRTFVSFPGLQQHIRKAHPVDFNDALEERAERRTGAWSAMASFDLAQAELGYDGPNLLRYLANRFGETEDRVKSHRRTLRYKNLLEKIRADREEAGSDPPTPPPVSPPPPPVSPHEFVFPNPPPPSSNTAPEVIEDESGSSEAQSSATFFPARLGSAEDESVLVPLSVELATSFVDPRCGVLVKSSAVREEDVFPSSSKRYHLRPRSVFRARLPVARDSSSDSVSSASSLFEPRTNEDDSSSSSSSSVSDSLDRVVSAARVACAASSASQLVPAVAVMSSVDSVPDLPEGHFPESNGGNGVEFHEPVPADVPAQDVGGAASPPSPAGPTAVSPAGLVSQDQDPLENYIFSLFASGVVPGEDIELVRPLLLGQAEMSAVVDGYLERLREEFHIPRPPARRRRRRPPGPRSGRYRGGAERATQFKMAQEAYDRDRPKLAESIVSGVPLGAPGTYPSQEEIFVAYQEVFATPSAPDAQHFGRPKAIGNDLYRPITVEEVCDVVRRPMSGASGPDGWRLDEVRSIPHARLALLFNLMVWSGHSPQSLKLVRTTLIPKGDADPAHVDNWRPITVASIIIRLLHKILGTRFRGLPFHPAQRGFMSIDGTLANTATLHYILKGCRAKSSPHAVATLDLRKAFDSVSHASIARAMERFSIDPRLARYILGSYQGCQTSVTCGPHTTPLIPVRRGVRQGDPLSPYLFNLVLDELVCLLDNTQAGIQVGDHRVTVLAYADDLLLLSPGADTQRLLLGKVMRFFENRSMQLNPVKSTNLIVQVVPARKQLYVATRARLFINGSPLRQITVDEQFKYLGFQFSFTGVEAPSLSGFSAALERLSRAPLKPFQKLEILRVYLIPRFLYIFQTPTVSAKFLKSGDKLLRRYVKRFLHLPAQTPNAFLHARLRDGGLGVFCFSTRIPGILLGRLDKLDDSGDRLWGAVSRSDHLVHLRERLSAMVRDSGVSGSAESGFWRSRLEASVSGNGLWQVGGRSECSGWIRNPPRFWSGEDFVKAIQLRGNLLPTQGGVHNPAHLRRCRAGCERTESLSHVLQGCPATHFRRIRRHDHLCGILRRVASKRGWDSEWEPRIRDGEGRLRKPDIVFRKGDDVIVCDLGVHWEGPDLLEAAWGHKMATYGDAEFRRAVESRYPGSMIVHLHFILGARGGWCPLNDGLVGSLGLTSSDVAGIVVDLLKGSILIHSDFGARV